MTAPGSFAPVPSPPAQPPAWGGQAPAPPPGPGVEPPFAAPPTEGDQRRMWLSLGFGGLALVLCCIGGVIGVVALGLTTVQAIDEQARTTVTRYLGALREQDYGQAYGLLCDRAQAEESVAEFTSRLSRLPAVRSFSIGEPELVDRVIVPAQVSYRNGASETVRYTLEQDRATGAFEVCGTAQ